MESEVTPFGWPRQTWENVKAALVVVGVLPIIAAAIFYVVEYPDREAAEIREAWRTVMSRPKVESGSEEKDRLARNWGGRSAIETLVSKGEKLNSIDLPGADLSGAKLKGGKFGWAGLSGVNFVDANLSHATVQCSDLRGARFIGAQLDNTNFVGSNITGATFHNNGPDAGHIVRILKSTCKNPDEPGPGFIVSGKPIEPITLQMCEMRNRAIPLGVDC